ncbi:MAG: endonuclease domain-containing protein [Oscillospiraceae bacterium]|nr:endonuclease domain-containing protein [Oscillospiraceae bacterium]
MNRQSNSHLTPISQNLRKNMTKEERRLWYDFLKLLPVTVNRQKVIGNYIVDFYCASSKLVIELDGSQHYTNEGLSYDHKRDLYLNSLGITVLRYSNLEIHQNFNGVCADISSHISIISTKPSP